MINKIYIMMANVIIISMAVMVALFRVLPSFAIGIWAAFQIPAEISWLGYLGLLSTTIAAFAVMVVDPVSDRIMMKVSDYLWDLQIKLGLEPEFYELD